MNDDSIAVEIYGKAAFQTDVTLGSVFRGKEKSRLRSRYSIKKYVKNRDTQILTRSKLNTSS